MLPPHVEGPELERHMTRYAMELLDVRRIKDRKPDRSRLGGTDPACGLEPEWGTYWIWASNEVDRILESKDRDPHARLNWPTCWICAAILGEIVTALEPGTKLGRLVVGWMNASEEYNEAHFPKPTEYDPPDMSDDIF